MIVFTQGIEQPKSEIKVMFCTLWLDRFLSVKKTAALCLDWARFSFCETIRLGVETRFGFCAESSAKTARLGRLRGDVCAIESDLRKRPNCQRVSERGEKWKRMGAWPETNSWITWIESNLRFTAQLVLCLRYRGGNLRCKYKEKSTKVCKICNS